MAATCRESLLMIKMSMRRSRFADSLTYDYHTRTAAAECIDFCEFLSGVYSVVLDSCIMFIVLIEHACCDNCVAHV